MCCGQKPGGLPVLADPSFLVQTEFKIKDFGIECWLAKKVLAAKSNIFEIWRHWNLKPVFLFGSGFLFVFLIMSLENFHCFQSHFSKQKLPSNQFFVAEGQARSRPTKKLLLEENCVHEMTFANITDSNLIFWVDLFYLLYFLRSMKKAGLSTPLLWKYLLQEWGIILGKRS